MQFVFGLVLGAILGVVVDRLWARMEARPKFRIVPGVYEEVGEREGFTLSISNIGSNAVPPFRPCFFRQDRGSFFLFDLSFSGPLLSGQELDCKLLVLQGGKPSDRMIPPIAGDGADDVPMGDRDWELRLVMDNSDRILCRQKEIGAGLVRSLNATLTAGALVAADSHEWMLPRDVPLSFTQRLRRACRRSKSWGAAGTAQGKREKAQARPEEEDE